MSTGRAPGGLAGQASGRVRCRTRNVRPCAACSTELQKGVPHAVIGCSRVNITHLVDTYGYWAVFLLVGAESLGVPLPGETALIVAGTYAGHTHRLSPWLIFAVAAAAAVIGDHIGYWIGDKGGYRPARRYGSKVPLDARRLQLARHLFPRHRATVAFFGPFVPVLPASHSVLARH